MYMGTYKKPRIHLVRVSMYEYSQKKLPVSHPLRAGFNVYGYSQKTSHPFSEGFNVYGYSQKTSHPFS